MVFELLLTLGLVCYFPELAHLAFRAVNKLSDDAAGRPHVYAVIVLLREQKLRCSVARALANKSTEQLLRDLVNKLKGANSNLRLVVNQDGSR